MITAEDIIKLITLGYWAAMLTMVGTAWFVVFSLCVLANAGG